MKKNDTNIKKAIKELKVFKDNDYESFDLDRLVAYTLFFLARRKIPLYFDYIAIALFRLFPKKFSMANFKQYPDTNRISKCLRRLIDPKRKNWATGNIENGFHLTEAGNEIANQVADLLKYPNKLSNQSSQKNRRSRGRFSKHDVEEIERSEIYKKWVQKNYNINDYEVLSFLRAMPYVPKNLVLSYFEELKLSVVGAKNKKVLRFLNWIEKRFKHLFY